MSDDVKIATLEDIKDVYGAGIAAGLELGRAQALSTLAAAMKKTLDQPSIDSLIAACKTALERQA